MESDPVTRRRRAAIDIVLPSVLDALESPFGPFGNALRNSSERIPRIFGVPPPKNLSGRLPEKQYIMHAFHHESMSFISMSREARLAELQVQIGLERRDWKGLFNRVSLPWAGRHFTPVANLPQEEEALRVRLDTISGLILCYNTVVFRPRGMELFLSSEPVVLEESFATSHPVDIHEMARLGKFWVTYIQGYPGEEMEGG